MCGKMLTETGAGFCLLSGEKDFGFERYTEYALDVPMYFAYRDHMYLDATKQRVTFREFLDGKLPLLQGETV